ncbi:histidinol-phosphatase HisJ [Aquibacillus koreensis]|uniref:Histidinol-phosphatase n=1 Tax=Aquibacillus koreensis TaxID=279446 RepID=A0A9X3WMD7_9BACI|nr:histidinol-phosphatase HisJ [Aquibacillus koreensis]MCT2536371.1 histidinol-phosphatase HisJ [Aquibacillus koreensis]MDC3421278.1 histidinol-phosphatase HisJ [Aquibacillus koreensis]
MVLHGDFHIHTNFCPHGSKDDMESYVVTAINKGMKSISFTEHAPLPKAFQDPTPEKDSAMKWEDIDAYFDEANRLKRLYENKLQINVGFEVDYIVGFEGETMEFLNKYGPIIEDAILSVHMLQAPNGEYACVDFSADEFERIIKLFGSVEQVYACYYDTVKQAVQSDLGTCKPMRIGHLTLIEKFSKLYPSKKDFREKIMELLGLIKKKNLQLDINTAGLYKEYCGLTYPNPGIMQQAKEMSIPMVIGSDSHTSKHIGRGFELLPDHMEFVAPDNIRN